MIWLKSECYGSCCPCSFPKETVASAAYGLFGHRSYVQKLFFHKYCCCSVVLARTRGWCGLWQFLAPGRSHRSDHPKINLSCVWRALFQWGFSGIIFNSPELILIVYRAILPNPALTRELFLPYWLMYNAMLYMAGSHRFSLDAGGPGAVRFTINSSRQRSCKRVIKEMISTL